MNYWRNIELPLTLWFVSKAGIKDGQCIMDIGSPKLLGLFLSAANKNNPVIASDISSYFVKDLLMFQKLYGLKNMYIKTLDGRRLPFKDDKIDQVFAISVLEHIPADGDSHCANEIGRVLTPGGVAIFTLPFAQIYAEEYLDETKTYWSDHSTIADGRLFFQRRYTYTEIMNRIVQPSSLNIKHMVLTAEYPIRGINKYQYNGKAAENCNFIDKSKLVKILKALSKIMVKSCPYQWIHSYYSGRYHYFTNDLNDPNLMNITIELQKNKTV